MFDEPISSAEVEIQEFLVGLGHAARQLRRHESGPIHCALGCALESPTLHGFQKQNPHTSPLDIWVDRKLRKAVDMRILEPGWTLIRLNLVEQNHTHDSFSTQTACIGNRGDVTLARLAPPACRLVILSPREGTQAHANLPRVRTMKQRRDFRYGIIGRQRADRHVVADANGKRDRVGVRVTHTKLYADVEPDVRSAAAPLPLLSRVIPCFMCPPEELPIIPRSGQVRLRVRYCECDPMGVVHHASYVPWLEIGRTELLRDGRTTYAQLEASGVLLAVVRLEVRYRRPARYDDLIEIRTRVTGTSRVKIEHEYIVVIVERELVPCEIEAVVATSTLACIGRDGRPQELPAWLQCQAPEGRGH